MRSIEEHISTPAEHSRLDLDRALAQFAYVALVLGFIFQLTVIPEILGIKLVGRIVNGSFLLSFGLLFVYYCVSTRSPTKGETLYFAAVFLVIAGYSINLGLSFDISIIGYASILLPFFAAASVPMIHSFRFDHAWTIYYWLIIFLSTVALVEYYAVFWEILPVVPHENPRNNFVRGIFTIFYDYGGPEPHYRLYGMFGEPGTAAMLALPSLAYAVLNGSMLTAFVLLLVFSLTDSTGGYISLLLTATLITYMNSRSRYRGLRSFILALSALALAAWGLLPYYFSAVSGPLEIISTWSSKVDLFVFPEQAPSLEQAPYWASPETKVGTPSLQVRIDNITNFIGNFWTAISDRPLGFRLTGAGLTDLARYDDYYGSNFMIYVAFVQGGILSLVGYLMLCGIAAWTTLRVLYLRPTMSKASIAAFATMPAMLLFSLQRQSFMETLLFAFLYAGPIIAALVGGRAYRYQATASAGGEH